MKITLTIEQRLSIAQFLPKEGSLSEQLIGKSIMDKTFISKSEREKIMLDQIYAGKIMPECNTEAEFELSSEEFDILYSDFLQKDKDRKINSSNVSLALKIRESKK